MATIFFSMAGEGRGHATRARSLVESLRPMHRIVLLAPEQAYDLLAPCYAGTDVEVRRIPGILFHYSDRRLDMLKTVRRAAGYLWQLPGLIRQLRRWIAQDEPALCVTDFEPALPRAAHAAGIPNVSLDHQHFLRTYDLSILPARLQRYAWVMGMVVRAYQPWATRRVVSGFFFPPLKRGWEDVVQVGPLLRPELTAIQPTVGRHLIAYLRPRAWQRGVDVLRHAGLPVKVYGAGERPPEGNLTFHAIDQERFMHDLASCDAVVCAAGNQTIGESLYLGKPILAIPESRHAEQTINAHFLGHMGVGAWSELESLTPQRLKEFLDRRESFRAAIDRARFYGNPAALAVLEEVLVSSGEPAGVPLTTSTPA